VAGVGEKDGSVTQSPEPFPSFRVSVLANVGNEPCPLGPA
jgi:hypothetical protein